MGTFQGEGCNNPKVRLGDEVVKRRKDEFFREPVEGLALQLLVGKVGLRGAQQGTG